MNCNNFDKIKNTEKSAQIRIIQYKEINKNKSI